MPRTRTPSFIAAIPLQANGSQEQTLEVRFRMAQQAYNACLGEALRRLDLMRERKAYQAARKLPAGNARRDAFRDLRSLFAFSAYGLHAWATRYVSHALLGDHLDVNTIQTIATRAFRAVEQYGFGGRGRPRFKGQNQIDSVEGKGNKQGLRWKEGALVWGDLTLTGLISTTLSSDPSSNPVLAHGLTHPIKYVRLIRRRLNGRVRFFAQLVCEGQPYRKAQHIVREGVVGIDPGPRAFGVAGPDWGAQVDLQTPLTQSRQVIRRLQRKIDRQRRTNNPTNYNATGTVKKGKLAWVISKGRRCNQVTLAEMHRKATAHRASLHGRVAHAILSRGSTIVIERNSYTSFQKTYGTSVGTAAPATFVAHLTRLAASAGGSVVRAPATLRLSQTCLCGTIRKKPLSERVHHCDCGITVQRDVWSAWLARFAVATLTKKGTGRGKAGKDMVTWRLDAETAHAAWARLPGSDAGLPAASHPLSPERFAALVGRWGKREPASGRAVRWAHVVAGEVVSRVVASEVVAGNARLKTREATDAVALVQLSLFSEDGVSRESRGKLVGRRESHGL